MAESRDMTLECVDPVVGERIHELELAGRSIEEDRLLRAHVEVCAHCRMLVRLGPELARALASREASPSLRLRSRRGRRSRWIGHAALVSAAASLILFFTLPMRPVGPTPVLRTGEAPPRFTSPVEGQVVSADGFLASWNPVEDADAYQVTIVEVGEGSSRSVEAEGTEVLLGPSTGLSEDSSYRLLLSTTPADLLSPGEVSVTVRTGGTWAVWSHRLRMAPFAVHALAILAFALTVLYGIGSGFPATTRSVT